MDPELTELQSTTLNPGFKNNDEFSGSFNITGNYTTQSLVITHTVTVPSGTDIADIVFQGRADGGFGISTGDPRPNDAWFKRGRVWARGDSTDGSGYSNHPVDFLLEASISGTTLTIKASSTRQYTGNLAITSETVQYKLIDYSVF